MTLRLKWLWIFILVFCLGCSGWARRSAHLAHNDVPAPNAIRGTILQPDRLAEGGRIQILPFSPGIFLPASEKADRAALLIMRGIMDGFAASNGLFHVTSVQENAAPDLIMTGRLTRFDLYGGWKRFFGGQRSWIIELDGRVIDRRGELTAVFSHTLRVPYTEMNETDFLLKAGQDIGIFLTGPWQ
jgi:hypothetical protein